MIEDETGPCFYKRIVATARTYIDTPFHHQGRLKGVGVDCLGLIVCVGREMGLVFDDFVEYSRQANEEELLARLGDVLVPLPVEMLRAGDVMGFRIGGKVRHVGLRTDKGILHTYQTVGRVVEHTFAKPWKNRLAAVFRIRRPG